MNQDNVTHLTSLPKVAQKSPYDKKIVTLKLLGGDEVVGRFVGIDEIGVQIEMPRVVVISAVGQAGLMPYAVSMQNQRFLKISHSAIVTIGLTDDNIATGVMSNITGLNIPPKSTLITPGNT